MTKETSEEKVMYGSEGCEKAAPACGVGLLYLPLFAKVPHCSFLWGVQSEFVLKAVYAQCDVCSIRQGVKQ